MYNRLSIVDTLTISHPQSVNPTASVTGFARSFLSSQSIENATITILENGQQFSTDKNGRFGPIQWNVGESITLVLEKKGYRTTQSATIIVPPEGLNDSLHEISFQVPSNFAFTLFSWAMGVTIDNKACQIAATITAYHKTMDDIPQGEPDAKVMISPAAKIKPFYFGIFESGPLKHKTNPLVRDLAKTSLDGGVGFLNVPPRAEPYTMSVVKEGTSFSEVKFLAREGVFINISPPQGPMALTEVRKPMPYPHDDIAQKNTQTLDRPKGWGQFGLYAVAFTGAAVALGVGVYQYNRRSPSSG